MLNPRKAIKEDLVSLFMGRNPEIKVISNVIGASSNLKKKLHLAIVGSVGYGKRITLKLIFKNLLPV